MFRGTLPADVREFLLSVIKTWDIQNIFVGCSGDFTIEDRKPK